MSENLTTIIITLVSVLFGNFMSFSLRIKEKNKRRAYQRIISLGMT